MAEYVHGPLGEAMRPKRRISVDALLAAAAYDPPPIENDTAALALHAAIARDEAIEIVDRFTRLGGTGKPRSAEAAVDALLAWGWTPPAPPYVCSQEPHPGVEFYGDGGCAECGYHPETSPQSQGLES